MAQERVRAVLITPRATTLLLRRVRPGIAPYYVTVGGGVEASDASREAALLREIREEIAGEADVVRLLHQRQNAKGETEYFYLARIVSWNFADRTGPEFQRADRGEYELVELPLSVEAVTEVNLVPEEIIDVLREALARGDLFTEAWHHRGARSVSGRHPGSHR